MSDAAARLSSLIEAYQPPTAEEAADVDRVRRLAAAGDPWTRASPLHATGSAVVVHPSTGRVLLRWHARQQAWLQVGGHADPGETDPFDIARREAHEETGLADLVPWPDASRPRILQVSIVPVPAWRGDAAHEHADIRYALATATPEAIVPESNTARLVWLDIDEARSTVSEANLRVCLDRIARLLLRIGDEEPGAG